MRLPRDGCEWFTFALVVVTNIALMVLSAVLLAVPMHGESLMHATLRTLAAIVLIRFQIFWYMERREGP